ncbi:MAG: sulfatase-like hydrolase/transferase [Pseudomonadota bacterium]
MPALKNIALALAALALVGCRFKKDTGTGDTSTPGPARTVVIITVDTIRPRVLHGADQEWNVSPTVTAFQQDAVWFRSAYTPRGMTAVALSSMLTGTYPRTHNVRSNEEPNLLTGATIADRFRDLGYTTLGYVANQGVLLDFGFDEKTIGNERDPDVVPEDQDDIGQVMNDQLLLDTLSARLADLSPTDKVFVWVHLNLPHSPYYEISPWFEEFHPEPYTGTLDTTDDANLNLITMGARPYDAADERYLEAVYASEIREADETIAGMLAAIEAAGRTDDGIVVIGADHGEELGDHNSYFFHGCSPYDSVIGVEYAVRAPGRWPQGVVVDEPISLVDIAPTVLELSGAGPWAGEQIGHSLVSEIQEGVAPSHDVFFERGVETAGLVRGDWKYILTPEGGYDQCTPYSGTPGEAYPAEIEELYHLSVDPDEAEDLATEEETERTSLSRATCAWVQSGDWVPAYMAEDNALLAWCAANWP